MSLFSDTLSEYIKSKKLKIYQLANLSGIDRTLIQKMISGTRKPANRGQILNLSRALSLTHSETENLINAYCILEIGEENWRRYKSIQQLIQSFHIVEPTSNISINISDFSFPDLCNTKVIHTSTTVNRILHSILLKESVHPDGFIKMMVQPTYSFLLNCLTSINFKQTPIDHYLCLESTPSQEIMNLENIQRIVPVLLNCRNYTSYGYYDHINSIFSSSVFLPNIILTSRYMIQISSDFSEAVVTDNAELVDLCQKYFDLQQTNSWPIFEQIKSFDEYLHFMPSGQNVASSYCIMNHPCVLSVLSPEILKRVLHLSMLSPDTITLLDSNLQASSESTLSTFSFFSMEGLIQFCNSGAFAEVPATFYSYLNKAEIQYLLERIISLSEVGLYHPRIFRPSVFEIPENLCIGTVSRQKSAIIFNHPQKGFLAFDVKNITFSSAIYDFMEYLQMEETMTYSEEESLQKIKDYLESYLQA